MRKILALFLAAMMMLCCASVFAEGTFRVGMECNYAPYNWTQANASEYAVEIEGGGGYADGYDVQIARKIAEGLGKELVIVKTEWDGLPMGVMTGAFDAIIAGMSPTEERKATIDFTDAYYNVQPVVVVRKDGPYANAKSVADLKGATCTSQQSTIWYDAEHLPLRPDRPDSRREQGYGHGDLPGHDRGAEGGRGGRLHCRRPRSHGGHYGQSGIDLSVL